MGVGIYQSAHQSSLRKKADKQFRATMAGRQKYQESEYAKADLSQARSMLGTQSPAVAAASMSGQQAVAARMGQAQRVAGSGADALAAGAQAQGQYNDMMPGLISEQQNYDAGNRRAYSAALQGMTGERQAVFQDQLAATGDQANYQLGKMGGAAASQSQAMGLAMTGLSTAAGSRYARGYGNYGKKRTAYDSYYDDPYTMGMPYN